MESSGDLLAQRDRENILDQLRFFTAGWARLGRPCRIEIRTLGEGVTPQSGFFDFDDDGLNMAADFAFDMCRLSGRNVYAVVNPLAGSTCTAANDQDVAGALLCWADCDDQASAQAVKDMVGPAYSAAVITGSVPHKRVHVYWQLAEPVTDLARWGAVQRGIAERLGSDAKVVNPSRIMRIGATITHPSKHKQAKGYISEVGRFHLIREDTVTLEAMERAFLADTPPAPAQGGLIATGGPAPINRDIATLRAMAGEHWHNNMISLVASYVNEGKTDAEIHALTDLLTTEGYSVEDTRKSVQTAIDGARRKGWTGSPMPEPAPVPDEPEALFVNAASLYGKPILARPWYVQDVIPDHTVTLFYGDGGTGKSLLALQLAVAGVTGRQWIGRTVADGGVLYLSAEDDLDEMHRRLADICETEGLSLSHLQDLTIVPRAGEDALLAMLDRRANAFATTPLFEAMERQIETTRPSLVVLDTLADLHSGDENDRVHARQFVGLVRGWAIRHQCAVLLLAHPSLSGMSSGRGTSGSTGWSNSVRSRIYLTRNMDDSEGEEDADLRTLSGKKSNYGPTGFEQILRWRDGVFHAETAPSGLDRMAEGSKAKRVFIKLLRLITEQGRYVSTSPSSTYAPSVFERHPENEGVKKAAFQGAMERLLVEEVIAIEAYGRPSKERMRIVEVTK